MSWQEKWRERLMSKNPEMNLLEGSILSTMLKLAAPIMATAFIQIAYNLVDTLWISALGKGPVAAIGTAAMFLWFADGLLLLTRMGGQVYTAQNIGAGERERARDYARACLQMTSFLGGALALLLILFRSPLIGFFRLGDEITVQAAETYLFIVALGVPAAYWTRSLSALMMAAGNSKIPFYVNSLGLGLNIILDPLLIFGFNLGVVGAALATIAAQFVSSLLLYSFFRILPTYRSLHILGKFQPRLWYEHFKLGLPTMIQASGFALISMLIARRVSLFGQEAIAAQKVGAQVESLSWMSADGFAAALTAFISQNYGGQRFERAQQAYRLTMLVMTAVGLFNTFLLFFGSGLISHIFFHEPLAQIQSAIYLEILALSQWFMCLEILHTAAYNGYGKTLLPSTIVLCCTAARIPLAWYLSSGELEVRGVWWAISLSSMAMGLILTVLFRHFQTQLPLKAGSAASSETA